MKRTTVHLLCLALGMAAVLDGGPPGFITSARTHLPGAGALVQSGAQTRELKAGDVVEHELRAEQVDGYQLSIPSAHYLRLSLEQRGLNVAVALFSPDGKTATQTNRQKFRQGIERLYWVTDAAGQYRLEVRSVEAGAPSGSYALKIEEVREATNRDRSQVAAMAALTEGGVLESDKSKEGRLKAIEKYELALKLFREAGDQWGEGVALQQIGKLYSNLEQKEKALEYLDKAIRIYHAAGDQQGEASALSDKGTVYGDDNNPALFDVAKALAVYEQALPLARSVGDKEVEARILFNEARLYDRPSGDFRKAIELYQLSLAPRLAAGDLSWAGATLNNMGMAYLDNGEPYQALRNFDQALAIMRTLGDRGNEAGYLTNVAAAFYLVNDVQKALDTLDQIMAIIHSEKLAGIEPYALHLKGTILSNFGEPERALETYEQALTLVRQLGMQQFEVAILTNMGEAYQRAGNYEKAMESYNLVLRVKVPGDSREANPGVLARIADVHLSLGNSSKALELLNKAISLFNENENREKADALEKLGRAYLSVNEPGKAMAAFKDAAKIDETAAPSELARLLLDTARAQKLLGNIPEARIQLEACLAQVESSRSRLVSPELRASYFATQQEAYYFHIDLLMDLARQQPGTGLEGLALETSEARRARSLLEGLTAARADIRRGVDPTLLKQEKQVGQRLAAKEQFRLRLLSAPHRDEQVATVDKEIAALLAEYQDTQNRIRKASPAYAAMTQPERLTASEIQRLLSPDTLLLEYSLDAQRSFVWAVTPDSITSYVLPARNEIEAASKSMYGLLTARQPLRGETEQQYLARVKAAEAQYDQQAQALSRMLLGPVADRLGAKRLLIVTDGSLGYLPFAALPSPGSASVRRALVSDHEIAYLPSASTLKVLRQAVTERASAPGTVAVIADPVFDKGDDRVSKRSTAPATGTQPDPNTSIARRAMRDAGLLDGGLALARLPFSRQEAEAIASLAPPARSLKALGFRANLATATSPDLAGYRTVHFATHALVNPTHPYLSGLLLSLVDEQGKPQDGFLTLDQIYNLNLPADLVVLSACQTATGKEVKGEGIVGLTRAFMYAGAPRIVASLWKVDDAATAEIMKLFYRGMLKGGLRPAAALQAAQMEMARSKLWASPFYWAGFVLQGEPN